MTRNVGLNLIGCSTVAMVFIIGVTEATEYKVGDSFGWGVPSNESFYKHWASTKKFFVGDKLVFNWTGEHTVAIEREATHYDICNTSAITSPFGSANTNETVFQTTLTETGPYYFLCTVGNHCARGQKFSINSDAPNSQPGSAASTLSSGILSTLLSILAGYLNTWFFEKRIKMIFL